MIKSYRSLVAVTLGFLAASLASAAEVTVYVGTYTDGTSKGIYRFSLDLETGKATARCARRRGQEPLVPGAPPERPLPLRRLRGGRLRRRQDGLGDRLRDRSRRRATSRGSNEVASEGGAPCHLVVDKGGKNVLVANYGGGTVAVLPIGPDGQLKKASAVRTHEGKGPNAQRQDKPHAHAHLPRRRRALRALARPRRRPGVRLALRRRARAGSRRTARASSIPAPARGTSRSTRRAASST